MIVATPDAPVTAVPVAAFVTVNCVGVAVATATPCRLNAVVDSPVIVTVCPTANALLAVYVTTPPVADAAVTVAVSELSLALIVASRFVKLSDMFTSIEV